MLQLLRIKFQQITMLSLAISQAKKLPLQGIRKENEALKAENAALINEINKFRKEKGMPSYVSKLETAIAKDQSING